MKILVSYLNCTMIFNAHYLTLNLFMHILDVLMDLFKKLFFCQNVKLDAVLFYAISNSHEL